ncbi:integrator complex subunit 8 [Daktulosphaira vitifoliae]|uniref:integrator complex subunit 8 n=1 Tax=Daktulosphaira vitifoliae TaxID=58002 RepID=UPI0021AA1E92|nr:integrator complex subunit 8 [Daktulosphaira vitifoliae]
MDVDLLRPGMIPIAPNTKLWFEFLIDPSLLEEHLNNPQADPNATDLLIKFLYSSMERPKDLPPIDIDDLMDNSKIEYRKRKKYECLKILAMRIVSFWEWDLNIFQTRVPISLQIIFVQDLLDLVSNELNLINFESHISIEDLSQLSDQQLFAIAFFHRWTLTAIINYTISKKSNFALGSIQDGNEDVLLKLEMQSELSEKMLLRLIGLKRKSYIIPNMETFIPPDELNPLTCNWSKGLIISSAEFLSQIMYDYSKYKFFKEQYEDAHTYFTKCRQLYQNLKPSSFYKIKIEELNGFCAACSLEVTENTNLFVQFLHSIQSNYQDVLKILNNDNKTLDIPLMFRDSLELDLASILSLGKFTASRDMLFQIQTLNAMRRALLTTEEVMLMPPEDYVAKIKANSHGPEIFFKELKMYSSIKDENVKKNFKIFIYNILLKCPKNLINDIIKEGSKVSKLFDEDEIQQLLIFPDDTPSFKVNMAKRFQRMNLKHNLGINKQNILLRNKICTEIDPNNVRNLLQQLYKIDPMYNVMDLNLEWQVPLPLLNLLISLPNGVLKFVLLTFLAKAEEMTNLNNFKKALVFLKEAENDVKNSNNVIFSKLRQLISWESLYVEMLQFQHEFKTYVIGDLIDRCKLCLETVQGDMIPRQDIAEQCVLTLLNIGEWEYLTTKRFSCFDLPLAIVYSCIDVTKFKGNKKSAKEIWDLVLPIFDYSYNNPNKRTLDGDSACNQNRVLNQNDLMRLFMSLRDQTAIQIVLSLLIKIQNILRDESSTEIIMPYLHIWPAMPNGMSFPLRCITDFLEIVLNETLKFHPNHIILLKLKGDLQYVMGHYSSAMKWYMEAIVIVSDYFARPILKPMIDDYVYKRMVRCCMQMQNFTQAAILCLFQDEVDYTTVFKCASETNSCDALDEYYEYIWDISLLEFLIYWHTKLNHQEHRQKLLKTIGALELNANNNEEIKREAANIRKLKFLRALSQQYIHP